MSDIPTLDLDELFGIDRPIQVRYNGQLYDLRRPEAFGPEEMVQFERLHSTYQGVMAGLEGGLQDYREKWKKASKGEKEKLSSPEEHEEEWINRLRSLMNELIDMLCEDFPIEEVSFQGKAHVLQFYLETVQEEEGSARKNVTTPQSEND